MMKRSSVLLVALIAFVGNVCAQNPAKQSDDYKRAEARYHLGLKYNDISVSKAALYDMIAIDKEDYSLLDSLAYIYFDYQQFASVALIGKQILAKYPNHLPALEMSAIAFENLGAIDLAISNYESLYLKNNSLFSLYKIASLQLQGKRYKEALNNLDIIIANIEAETMPLEFPLDNNQAQRIPMKAAALNLKGLLYKETGEAAQAKTAFEAALAIAPDFAAAKENMK